MRLVDACLQKDRDARPNTVALVQQLTGIRARLTSPGVDLASILRRPAIVVSTLVAVVGVVATGWWWSSSTARVRWARDVAMPEVRRLADRADFDGAFRLAREALEVLPDDGQIKQAWFDVSTLTRITPIRPARPCW